MNRRAKIVALICVLPVVGFAITGCTVEPSEQAKSNFGSVELGMSKSEVTGLMGEPDSGQHFESEFMGDTTVEECFYWGLMSYQLCFTDGELTSKNSY